MSFFQRQEEVLDIELTKHGRRKLMKGEFDPEYYSFHDEAILYDSNYAGFDEDTVVAQDRILDSTAYSKAQANFQEAGRIKKKDSKNRADKLIEREKLGTADIGVQKAPAFYFESLGRQISSVQSGSSSLAGNMQNIPQINMGEIEYGVEIQLEPVQSNTETDDPDTSILDETVGNNRRVIVKKKPLTFAVDEENSPFKNDNFELTLYEVNDKKDGEKELDKVPFFRSPQEKPFQEIYEPDVDRDVPPLTSASAEYYFDIKTDEAIERQKLCRLLDENTKDIFKEEIECDQVEENENVTSRTKSRYDSDVDPGDIGEKC